MKLNSKYHPYLESKDRIAVLVGGAGSGKSVAACQKAVIRMMSEKGHTCLVIRKYFNSLKNSIYQELKNVIEREGLSKVFTFTLSPLEITCQNGNKFIFCGTDDVEKLKSITGVTFILIEEASEITFEDFTQISLRLRPSGDLYPQITMMLNPIDENLWINKQFFQNKQENTFVLRSTYKDNAFLQQDYKNTLEALKDQDINFYNIYAKGLWGQRTNTRIFNNYSVENIPQDIYSYEKVSIGLDYGFTHAFAALLVGIKGDTINVLREIYAKGQTNTDIINLIKSNEYFNGNITIMADAAEPDRILEMKRAGLPIQPTKKGPGSVKIGIDYLRRYKILIHPSCVKTAEEIQNYKYKQSRTGEILESPVDFADDTLAALRYAVENWHLSQPATMKVLAGLHF